MGTQQQHRTQTEEGRREALQLAEALGLDVDELANAAQDMLNMYTSGGQTIDVSSFMSGFTCGAVIVAESAQRAYKDHE